jgi:uncharacterized protein YutE (UPF0331/DUF86 family)
MDLPDVYLRTEMLNKYIHNLVASSLLSDKCDRKGSGCAMFITDSLKQHVDEILRELEVRARWLEQTGQQADGWAEDETQRWAAERAFHVAIECATDVANLLIDALVMRDPGGYADILRVLMEEGVVNREWFDGFAGAIRLRQRLVREYLQVKATELEQAARTYGPALLEYAAQVRAYIDGDGRGGR